jgi:hypothetical protein
MTQLLPPLEVPWYDVIGPQTHPLGCSNVLMMLLYVS